MRGCVLALSVLALSVSALGCQAFAQASSGTESTSGTSAATGSEGASTNATTSPPPTSGANDDTQGEGSRGSTASASTTDDPTTAAATGEQTGSGSDSSPGSTGARNLPGSCAEVLLEDASAATGPYTIDVGGGAVEVYCDMDTDGGGWTRFWWWTPGVWPNGVNDVLQSAFGDCAVEDAYCMGRLPALDENTTSLLAVDPITPTKYRWDFDAGNDTAHAAWRAFADHELIASGVAMNGDVWNPTQLEGSLPPPSTQDSFMYRSEHGVASILLDDDNCDCLTTLQMGHGMCFGSWGSGNSAENVFGVDLLRDDTCIGMFEPGGPDPSYHLELFYR